MNLFGFTHKKFIKLNSKNQHAHVIKWLSKIYQTLTANRLNQTSLDIFSTQYNQVLTWIGWPPFSSPETLSQKKWMEVISDQIHLHRKATGQSVKDHDLVERVQTRDLQRIHQQPNIDCHIALDGLRSLFNIGSIFRTCDAAGFNSLILGNCPGKEESRVKKISMGASDWIEQEKTEDLAKTLLNKKQDRYTIIGVETVEGSTPYDQFHWQEKSILVFGNEEYGLSSHVMGICDAFIHIPMFGRKNSLNVANAVAVICFQAVRHLESNN